MLKPIINLDNYDALTEDDYAFAAWLVDLEDTVLEDSTLHDALEYSAHLRQQDDQPPTMLHSDEQDSLRNICGS